MTLYDMFGYTEEQTTEINYLLEIVNKLKIVNTVDESLFQFSPKLVEQKTERFNEHEPWFVFHKHILFNDIIFYLLEQSIECEYTLEDEINDQVWNESYNLFLVVNELKDLSKEEIIKVFKEKYNIAKEIKKNIQILQKS